RARNSFTNRASTEIVLAVGLTSWVIVLPAIDAVLYPSLMTRLLTASRGTGPTSTGMFRSCGTGHLSRRAGGRPTEAGDWLRRAVVLAGEPEDDPAEGRGRGPVDDDVARVGRGDQAVPEEHLLERPVGAVALGHGDAEFLPGKRQAGQF